MARSAIGALLDPSSAFVTTLLAALRSGRAIVPLAPEYPDERLRFMLEDSGAGVLVTERAYLERARRIAALAGVRDVVLADGEPGSADGENPVVAVHGWSEVATTQPGSEPERLPADAPAYVVYTSGTTGAPKGVSITHENLIPLLRWQEEHFGLGEEVRGLQTLSPSFDFGLQEILTTVLFGGCLVFPGRARLQETARYAAFATEERVTMVYMTPSYCDELVAAGRPLPTLRTVLIGGELLSARTVRGLRELVPSECAIFNGYGPTEASINCAMLCVEDEHVANGADIVAVGRPTGDSRVYIVDQSLEAVPLGVSGEVAIGGPGVADGYLKRPDLTAERFVPDPLSDEPGARLYLSGDVGRLGDHGNLEILGRLDDQVKIRGFRVELGEIESVLRGHETVRECVVLRRDDVGGSPLLVAYVVTRNAAVDPEELRRHLRSRLPDFMVPASFVPLRALPLTAHGKVDRRSLPPPPRSAAARTPPRTELERTVAAVWRDVLGLHVVGADENFFELGGHSLLVAQLQLRLQEALARPIEIHTLFEYLTVRSFARFLSDGEERLSLRQSDRRRQARERRLRSRRAHVSPWQTTDEGTR